MNQYKKAGVDVEAGYQAVERMKKHVLRTHRDGVMGGIGGFSGCFQPDLSRYKQPVLVSGTDGVGTKLMVAQAMGVHDTVGVDCVAMCANDVLCSGAEPLFFLDYIACGKNHPEVIEAIVKGVADGCVQAGCALVGGETAEMPGMYDPDEYDLAGFCVGIAEKDRIMDRTRVTNGDILIGLLSSGVHSNGFSLVRRILGDRETELRKEYPGVEGPIGMELLKPTRIYVKQVLPLLEKVPVHGMCHITGGGFPENIPRMLPEGLRAVIRKGSWPVPAIFRVLQREGDIPEAEMYGVFNMGIGLILAMKPAMAKKAATILGEQVFEIGHVEQGKELEII